MDTAEALGLVRLNGCQHTTITMASDDLIRCANCREEMVFLPVKSIDQIRRWSYREGYTDARNEQDARYP